MTGLVRRLPGRVCTSNGPWRGGGSEQGEGRQEHSFLSLLLPAWETCSPSIKAPDLLVTGARPTHESNWTPMVKVLPRFGKNTAAVLGPMPGVEARTAAA